MYALRMLHKVLFKTQEILEYSLLQISFICYRIFPFRLYTLANTLQRNFTVPAENSFYKLHVLRKIAPEYDFDAGILKFLSLFFSFAQNPLFTAHFSDSLYFFKSLRLFLNQTANFGRYFRAHFVP